jgi:methyl-accepting chemotaxis protein
MMKIFARLLVGFLTVSILGAAIAITGMVYAIQFSDAAQKEYQKSTLGLADLIDMQDAFSRMRIAIREYSRATDAQSAQSTATSIADVQTEFETSAKQYLETLFNDKGKADYDQLESLLADYYTELKQIYALFDQKKTNEIKTLLSGGLRDTEKNIRTLVSKMTKDDEGYAQIFSERTLKRTGEMKFLLPLLILAGVIVSILIGFFISRSIIVPLRKIGRLAGDIAAGRTDPKDEAKGFSRRIHIQSRDEVGELGGYFNQLLEMLEDLLHRIETGSRDISGMVHGLSASNQEINATANEQAAAAKEIASTIEDTDKLSKNISARVSEVGRITNDTKTNVQEGFAAVQQNIAKMGEIHEANEKTIKGINFLGEKIKNIWDIVNMINSIADQTKIIAFNAELEASSAGEAGKNFQIVASEIRRLADSTVNSTNEIKMRIQEISRSSDSLLLSSEQGTEQIKQGKDLSVKMSQLFEEISSSADISNASTQQIALSIRQQVDSFDQIVIAIKQISQGIDNFVVATKGTSSTTEELRQMAGNLASLLKRFEG